MLGPQLVSIGDNYTCNLQLYLLWCLMSHTMLANDLNLMPRGLVLPGPLVVKITLHGCFTITPSIVFSVT